MVMRSNNYILKNVEMEREKFNHWKLVIIKSISNCESIEKLRELQLRMADDLIISMETLEMYANFIKEINFDKLYKEGKENHE